MKRKIFPMQKYTTRAEFPLVTGDVNAYEIEFDIGQDITGAEFKVVAIRADGKVIEDLGKVTDGVATYTLANNMYSVPGQLTVRLQILHNSSILTDREFVFNVIEGCEKTLDPKTEVPILDNLLLRISKLESNGYTKTQIDDKLSGKADKFDITNVYKFCGSAPTFEGLPFAYQLIPNGAPTKNGEVCGGYYPYEEDGVVLQRVLEIDTTLNSGDVVIIPIVPITIKAGTYMPRAANIFGDDLVAKIGLYDTRDYEYSTFDSEQTIDHIEVYFPYTIDEPVNYPLVIETDNFGELKKVADSWLDPYYGWRIPAGAYDNGAVYNVLDTGMNYAWNGTEYDALGGEHKDLEARSDIEKMNSLLKKLDERLLKFESLLNTEAEEGLNE